MLLIKDLKHVMGGLERNVTMTVLPMGKLKCE